MNTIREIQRLNEQELSLGVSDSRSWHAQYARSAWVFVGNLAPELNEGDVLCVFSQWGEVEDLHLVRDEGTGRSKGFAFLKFEDARSAVLAVDNMNGAALLERTLRVDHKMSYEPPKKKGEAAVEREAIAAGVVLPARPMEAGHAYAGREVAGGFSLAAGQRVWGAPPPPPPPPPSRFAPAAAVAAAAMAPPAPAPAPAHRRSRSRSRSPLRRGEEAAAAAAPAGEERRRRRHHRSRSRSGGSRSRSPRDRERGERGGGEGGERHRHRRHRHHREGGAARDDAGAGEGRGEERERVRERHHHRHHRREGER
jgi:RNA-binding motif X-linked protein 2